MRFFPVFIILTALFCAAAPAGAQERAYFVTYDHYLEETGNLEVAVASTTGFPKAGQPGYFAPWLELEYGVKGWWTTELYLEGVATRGNGSGFTGWRWENRFRPLKNEHRINPVLYVEYEDVNEASRIQKEIVGSGSLPFEPIAELRREHAHELEGKIILSSAARGWNIAENFIVEKNLSEDEGFEFGYSVGVSRSLGALAAATPCALCRESVVAGVELYGALGSSDDWGLKHTRHVIAPAIGWRLPGGSLLKASTGFGLTETSDRYLLRVAWAREISIKGGR